MTNFSRGKDPLAWKDFITYERKEGATPDDIIVSATLKLGVTKPYNRLDYPPPTDPETLIRGDLTASLVAFAKHLTSDSCHVITISGSMRFKDEMKKSAVKLSRGGAAVFIPIILDLVELEALTPADKLHLKKLQERKIEISDTLFVVNVGGYIDEDTQNEIDYANSIGRQVIYYENLEVM